MLHPIDGKPLIQWVWEAASNVKLFYICAICLDHKEVANEVEKFGGRYYFTSPDCPSGTDRLIEIMQRGEIDADIWVNWQGDEPQITEAMIEELLQSEDGDVWTLKKRITSEDAQDPNTVKVVTDEDNNALYFSRSPIPYGATSCYKHVGLYAYTKEALQKIAAMKPHPLEISERLEQLRFLANGLKIKVHETVTDTVGVDTPADVEKLVLVH